MTTFQFFRKLFSLRGLVRARTNPRRLKVALLKDIVADDFTMLDVPGCDQYAVSELTHARGMPDGD
jgi:hypothetical protein